VDVLLTSYILGVMKNVLTYQFSVMIVNITVKKNVEVSGAMIKMKAKMKAKMKENKKENKKVKI